MGDIGRKVKKELDGENCEGDIKLGMEGLIERKGVERVCD